MDSRRFPRISLDQLRAFHAAAEHLSFTQAAKDLFVTQSAVSRGIKTLESQLCRALFRRVNRTLQLTRAGDELHRCTKEVFALVDATVARLSESETTLSIATTVPFASLWLAPRLPHFVRAHPGMNLRIVASNAWSNLEREHIDLAIRFAPISTRMTGAEKLADYRTFPICSPALLSNTERPLRTYADLAHHVILDFETTIGGRQWSDWELWFKAMNVRPVTPARLLRFSHYDQLIQTVLEGGGVAIGRWPHVSAQLRAGVICAPFSAHGVATLGSFDLIISQAAADLNDVSTFVAWLKQQLLRDTEQLLEQMPAAKGPKASRHVKGSQDAAKPQ